MRSRYVTRRPWWYPRIIWGASLDGASYVLSIPLHYLKKGEEGRKKKKVLHLSRCYTHTPGRAGKTLKGKRKKKADTRRADGQKTAQGGEGNKRTSGTNLHGETDLTKTAHTPKPHDTLRRGTRGKLGTKWGTSWWQTRKPKQLIKNRTQFLTTWRSCVIPLPGPWSSLPQLAKTAFKFHRIRCTICLTSPDNHQKKKTTPEGHEPAWSMHRGMLQYDCKSCCEKEVFWMFGMESHWKRSIPQDSLGQREQRDIAKWCITVRQAVALYLNELLY